MLLLVGPARTSPATWVHISSQRHFHSVDIGRCNQEEKVERRHRRDRDQETKKQEERGEREREERKDIEKREMEKERKGGGASKKRNGEGKQARLCFYNYCGLARIKGN